MSSIVSLRISIFKSIIRCMCPNVKYIIPNFYFTTLQCDRFIGPTLCYHKLALTFRFNIKYSLLKLLCNPTRLFKAAPLQPLWLYFLIYTFPCILAQNFDLSLSASKDKKIAFSVGQGGPPLGINTRHRRRRKSQGLNICPHPEDGIHIGGIVLQYP